MSPKPSWMQGSCSVLWILVTCLQADPRWVNAAVTFNHDVAPILFANCTSCHRPGLSAPFPLVTVQDARKHAAEIVDVTQRGYMPPWLPEGGCGHFVGERFLDAKGKMTLRQWIDDGLAEGNPEDLPLLPTWTDGWYLGPPDLVVSMPSPYILTADGKDVYRNFVIPIPLQQRHFIRGIEFRPGNARVVHHAFINLDATRKSRGLAAGENPPSFGGMDLPETSVMPGGQFLSWQPGKVPYFSPDNLSWVLNTGSDLVLQLHLHPSGKPEPVQATVGFYFTDQPPTNSAFRLELVRFDLGIPAQATNYIAEQAYTLPVDVHLMAISPHTHYLGRDLSGTATLPSGEQRCLFHIPDWDFNWQGDYRYAEPVFLPKGTTLRMRYQFDNSSGNPRNPNHPPIEVKYGLQTTDEMAELWFQVLPIRPGDLGILSRDYFTYRRRFLAEMYEARLRLNPNDGETHLKLGSAYEFLGRDPEAFSQFVLAAKLLPGDAKARYQLGYQYLARKQYVFAIPELEAAVKLDPKDHQAFGCLGIAQVGLRDFEHARQNFQEALRLNPDDSLARDYLAQIKGLP